jgi:hypothetical protein
MEQYVYAIKNYFSYWIWTFHKIDKIWNISTASLQQQQQSLYSEISVLPHLLAQTRLMLWQIKSDMLSLKEIIQKETKPTRACHSFENYTKASKLKNDKEAYFSCW